MQPCLQRQAIPRTPFLNPFRSLKREPDHSRPGGGLPPGHMVYAIALVEPPPICPPRAIPRPASRPLLYALAFE